MAGKRKTTVRTTRRKAPVLVLGWGNDGCGDVDHIASMFNNDDSIDWAKGRFADSKEVEREIAEWLEGHDNAQTLYLGCHGLGNGLGAGARSLSKLGYRELSEIITNHLKADVPPLTVILGACESSTAADVWNALNQGSVGLLVAFPKSPDSETVRIVLEHLLKHGDQSAIASIGSSSSKVDCKKCSAVSTQGCKA